MAAFTSVIPSVVAAGFRNRGELALQPKRTVWAVSLAATRDSGAQLVHVAYVVVHHDKREVEEAGLKAARDWWPEGDGWSLHAANACLVSQSAIDQVVAEERGLAPRRPREPTKVVN